MAWRPAKGDWLQRGTSGVCPPACDRPLPLATQLLLSYGISPDCKLPKGSKFFVGWVRSANALRTVSAGRIHSAKGHLDKGDCVTMREGASARTPFCLKPGVFSISGWVCGTPQPRLAIRPGVPFPGLRSTADPCHPRNSWLRAKFGFIAARPKIPSQWPCGGDLPLAEQVVRCFERRNWVISPVSGRPGGPSRPGDQIGAGLVRGVGRRGFRSRELPAETNPPHALNRCWVSVSARRG